MKKRRLIVFHLLYSEAIDNKEPNKFIIHTYSLKFKNILISIISKMFEKNGYELKESQITVKYNLSEAKIWRKNYIPKVEIKEQVHHGKINYSRIVFSDMKKCGISIEIITDQYKDDSDFARDLLQYSGELKYGIIIRRKEIERYCNKKYDGKTWVVYTKNYLP